MLRAAEAHEAGALVDADAGVAVLASQIVRREEILELERHLHGRPGLDHDPARLEVERVNLHHHLLDPGPIWLRDHFGHRDLGARGSASQSRHQRGDDRYSNERSTRHALLPPNPNEFESTV